MKLNARGKPVQKKQRMHRGVMKPVASSERGKCRHLGVRLEFMASCLTGFKCLHKCDAAAERDDVKIHLELHPQHQAYCTTPAFECQDCPGWEEKPRDRLTGSPQTA